MKEQDVIESILYSCLQEYYDSHPICRVGIHDDIIDIIEKHIKYAWAVGTEAMYNHVKDFILEEHNKNNLMIGSTHIIESCRLFLEAG